MSGAILELLIGAKVFDGTAWHIYDETGTELTNPAGVRGLGKMGALLMWPREDGGNYVLFARRRNRR